MKPRHSRQAIIDEYILDKKLEVLRDLMVNDFNLRADCTTAAVDACVECDGGVYVPRGETAIPDYRPTCHANLIRRMGSGPGWTYDAVST